MVVLGGGAVSYERGTPVPRSDGRKEIEEGRERERERERARERAREREREREREEAPPPFEGPCSQASSPSLDPTGVLHLQENAPP